MTPTFAQLALVGARLSAQPASRVSVLPLLNLFLTLIPFLLLCASVTPTASQRLGFAPAAPVGAKLMVYLRPTLFRVEVTEAGPRHQGRALAQVVPRLDRITHREAWTQLGLAVARIKERYPALDAVTVVPDETVAYEDVLQLMDALRDGELASAGVPRRSMTFSQVAIGAPVAGPR